MLKQVRIVIGKLKLSSFSFLDAFPPPRPNPNALWTMKCRYIHAHAQGINGVLGLGGGAGKGLHKPIYGLRCIDGWSICIC